jgi:ribose transport system substrate-binding protein
MPNRIVTKDGLRACLLGAALVAVSAPAMSAPKIVAGPAGDPKCMAPWTAYTKFMQFEKKAGPYRIALANGYLANT